jgi:hypothetical protein
MWFTTSGSVIGRIAMDGTISTFKNPSSIAAPSDIAAGPDGALWFTNTWSSNSAVAYSIGRITTSGVATRYSGASLNPLAITLGPDGNMWFVNSEYYPGAGNSSVGRITTGVTPPDAPVMSKTATGGNQKATVSWTAPRDGGAPITGYVVTPYVGYYPLPSTTFNTTATTQTITGLTNGTSYRFKVAAINANGTGPMSTVSNPVTPAPTAPDPPTIVRNATSGDRSATVNWVAPASNGGSPITGYVVTPFDGYYPLPSRTFNDTATTQTITGLANGTTYRFKVAAVNAIGTGPTSTISNPVTPTA